VTPLAVAWRDVFPWAQILGTDGHLWSVLPSYPIFPRQITRAGMGVFILPAHPDQPVTIYVPDESDAVATLRATLDAELVGVEPAPGVWHCPATVTHWQLARHLRDFHSYPLASLGASSEYETHRLHNGFHHQVSMWPLPVTHIHTREVQT